jgi:uncharacterized membrane protein
MRNCLGFATILFLIFIIVSDPFGVLKPYLHFDMEISKISDEKVVENKEENKLLTQQELANYLGITIEESLELGPLKTSENTVQSKIPNVKLKGEIYYFKAEVDNWLGYN